MTSNGILFIPENITGSNIPKKTEPKDSESSVGLPTPEESQVEQYGSGTPPPTEMGYEAWLQAVYDEERRTTEQYWKDA